MAVAPHVGAWIETSAALMLSAAAFASRPTWARGLKQSIPYL